MDIKKGIVSWDDDLPLATEEKTVVKESSPEEKNIDQTNEPDQESNTIEIPAASSQRIIDSDKNLKTFQDALDLTDEEIAAGVKDLAISGARIRSEDKRMINGNSDVNQLIPFKYDWCWQKYLDAKKNHWMPTEISMAKDVQQWKANDVLSDDERLVVHYCLGYFSTADTVVANNLALSVFSHITAPEARQYILLQAAEECLHVHAYQYIIESLGMDEGEIFNLYREVPVVSAKQAWSLKHTKEVADRTFTTGTSEANKAFIRNLVAYYCVTEGIFFYCGFPLILSMGRNNGKMSGTAEQFQYILRDESMHLNFGIDVINMIKIENPELWDEELQADCLRLIREGVYLEIEFARHLMPRGILGMNASIMEDYLKFIGNRRLNQLGLPSYYEEKGNPFPWMSEQMDLNKEKNFFETRVTEYQVGGALTWD